MDSSSQTLGPAHFFLEAPWPSHLPQEVALINIFMDSIDRRFVLKRQTDFLLPKSLSSEESIESVSLLFVFQILDQIFLPSDSNQLEEWRHPNIQRISQFCLSLMVLLWFFLFFTRTEMIFYYITLSLITNTECNFLAKERQTFRRSHSNTDRSYRSRVILLEAKNRLSIFGLVFGRLDVNYLFVVDLVFAEIW